MSCRRFRGIVFLVAGAAAVTAPLARADSDLALDVEVSPALAIYGSGTSGVATFRVHSDGPDAAVGARVAVHPFAFGGLNSQIVLTGGSETAPCTLSAFDLDPSPGFHGFFFLELDYPEVAAGGSVDCGIRFEVQAFARGTYELGGVVSLPTPGDDPVAGNNASSIPLTFTAPGAPSAIADLALSLAAEPARAWHPPGSLAEIVFIVENRGPDATGPSVVRLDSTRSEELAAGIELTAPIGGAAPCLVGLEPPGGGSVDSRIRLDVPSLLPGQSETCRLTLRVGEGATSRVSIDASVVSEPDFGEATADPNASNNRASVAIHTTAPGSVAVVPVGGFAAMACLASALLLFGVLGGGLRGRRS